jgi:hypothetical protein
VKAEQIIDLFHRQFGGGQSKQTLTLKEILLELKIQCQISLDLLEALKKVIKSANSNLW